MKAYLLRILKALDAFVQAFLHLGTLGIYISSRIGTASAHGHAWGIIAERCLEAIPFFGPGHCKRSIVDNIADAEAVIAELSDPVVSNYANADWREP